MTCEICLERPCTNLMCEACQKSYDKQVREDDGTLHSVLVWACRRARYFERKRHRELTHVVITGTQKSLEEVQARIAAFKDSLEPPRIIEVIHVCEKRMWTKNSAETRQCVLPKQHDGKHEYGKPELVSKSTQKRVNAMRDA